MASIKDRITEEFEKAFPKDPVTGLRPLVGKRPCVVRLRGSKIILTPATESDILSRTQAVEGATNDAPT